MPRDHRARLTECRICLSDRLRYAFSRDGLRLEQCEDCGLLFQNPQPSDEELAKIYSQNYFLAGDTDTDRAITAGMKHRTAELYLNLIRGYAAGGRLLEVGCGEGDLLQAARDAGFGVVGVEINEYAAAVAESKVGPGRIHCGGLSDLRSADRFDVCVLSDVIEHTRDPLAVLAQVRTLLRPDGVLFMALPSLDSWSARLLKSRWMEFKEEHLFYFNRSTLEHALFAAGFERIVLKPGLKVLTLEYVARHFEHFPVRGLTTVVTLVARLVPSAVRRHMVKLNPSGMIVLARPGSLPVRRKLS
jgi:2-polyprenyl-3-methyl-5-hydroxy-6-metoxy-1,4-benzoquinol methylase